MPADRTVSFALEVATTHMATVPNTKVIVLMWLALAMAPLDAAAQSVHASWPGLTPNTLVTVFVTDDAGAETTGKLLGWTTDSLLLWRDGAEHHIERDAVVRIERRDSLRNGAIVGAVVGALMGLFAATISDCPSGSDSGCLAARSGLAALSAVTYTGMGIGLDAMIRGRTTVYERDRQPRATATSASGARASVRFGIRW